jgi:hypothetical protein
MHIDNTYLTNRTLSQTSTTEPPVPSNDTTPSGLPAPVSSSHVPSPELLDLLDQVRQVPEVRREAVMRAVQRVASGYYLNRAAAEQAAESIQNAQD